MPQPAPLPTPDPRPTPDRRWPAAYASVEIDAPITEVWARLVSVADYDTWNPFTYAFDTPQLAVGQRFTFTVRMSPRNLRRQPEVVTAIRGPHHLAWGMASPSRWLHPERHQVLTELGPDRTRYETWERFEGWLGPVVGITVLGAVQRGFDDVARALKETCEA